jgi:NADH-quinone oxidoreductase subunit H
VSYEVFMGLSSLMGVVAQAGSFNMRDIVEYQARTCGSSFRSSLASVPSRYRGRRGDSPSPIRPAGSRTGTGRRLPHRICRHEMGSMFFVGEYIGIVLISALLVDAVLRWLARSVRHPPQLAIFWFVAEDRVLHDAVHPDSRFALPRPRYDQVMAFSWKVLPAADPAQPAGDRRRRAGPRPRLRRI